MKRYNAEIDTVNCASVIIAVTYYTDNINAYYKNMSDFDYVNTYSRFNLLYSVVKEKIET